MAHPDDADTIGVEPDPPPVRRQVAPVLPRGQRSRWVASEVTFGPVGRIIATAVVLGVVCWINNVLGIFGMVFLAIYASQVLPTALRDIWQPVRLPPTEQDVIRAQADAMRRAEEPPTSDSPIATRQAPTRW
ncbi:MAG TPA: hypothetical protein VFH66_14235 [Mycobacteriales bacterium]|nr:hypothetical protein [Mycobacteriales bacterium]